MQGKSILTLLARVWSRGLPPRLVSATPTNASAGFLRLTSRGFHKAGNAPAAGKQSAYKNDAVVYRMCHSTNMSSTKSALGFELSKADGLTSSNYDGVLYVYSAEHDPVHEKVSRCIDEAKKYNSTVAQDVSVVALDVPAGRMVVSPVGRIDPDYDDVRVFKEAAHKGVQKLLKLGMKKPLLVLQSHPRFEDAELVTLLGVLEALHVSIQIRELKPGNLPTIDALGVHHPNAKRLGGVTEIAIALESGRRIARDIGEGDPERMAPPRVEEYVNAAFKNSTVTIKTVKDINVISKEYPLFEAVNRAASKKERHQGRIMFLEYAPNGLEVKNTLMLVGKGVTYDTGGADLKVNGVMAGMSRDKCGAAAVAGFMKVVDILKPKDVKVVAALSLVRNSIGSDCYVADELIKARSGQLVRIGNTDAEGRMVMADVLCQMKELAVNEVNPHLFTVATLTGHAYLTVGPGYSIVMDNGVARNEKFGEKLRENADAIGEPVEVSTVRKEDFGYCRGKAAGDDVVQSNNAPSSRTPRGHQGPAGFLIMTSGLHEHGSCSKKPLKYSHLDIAASAGDFPSPGTGTPILGLAKTFLL